MIDASQHLGFAAAYAKSRSLALEPRASSVASKHDWGAPTMRTTHAKMCVIPTNKTENLISDCDE